MTMSEWQRDRLRESLVQGITLENAEKRIGVLLKDLKAHEGDSRLRVLAYQLEGTVDEVDESSLGRKYSSSLASLLGGLGKAAEAGVEIQTLLAWIDEAPDSLVPRLRMWLLGHDHETNEERIVQEVANSIGRRSPTGDDLKAIEGLHASDRITDAVLNEWKGAIPKPPGVAEVGEALSRNALPDGWMHVWEWSGLLPEVVTANWKDVKTLLGSRYGDMNADRFRGPRPIPEAYTVGSPMSAEDLGRMDVLAAADWINSWERGPYERRVGYRELARALTAVVSEKPAAWGAEPIEVIAHLKEPIYVAHYLRGLTQGMAGLPEDAAPRLIEAVQLVFASPWEARTQGRDSSWDYDPDWGSAMEEGIELLGALASNDRDFGERKDAAWELISSAVRNTERGSGIIDPDHDPLSLAINRPCTKALKTVCHVMGLSYRQKGSVDEEAFPILDWVLQQTGADGQQFRAILASRVGFLRTVSGEWFESRVDQLFGAEIDRDLGISALSSAVRWGGLNRWLMERYTAEILQLARQREERAMDFALIAMVWEIEGYEPETLVERFSDSPEVLSFSGERLAFVLRPDDVDMDFVQQGLQYWERVLVHDGQPMRMKGFGWFAEVDNAEDDAVLDRILATLSITEGVIDWPEGVSKRFCCPPIDPRALSVLWWLLRGATEPWVEQRIAGHALSSLQQSTDQIRESDEFAALKESLLARGFFAAEDA